MSQRHIGEECISYALLYGKQYDRAGAKWFVLRLKDIPLQDRSNDRILKMNGVVVCMERDVVSTVYRHERPSHHIRRKQKFQRARE